MMPLTEIEPVDRESTASLIARQLREAIRNGSLRPGAQLGEADLAARFQVSRGPLREAMQRLVSEGLLRSERHRGLFVIDLDTDDVHDIYTARSAVECAAARLVLGGDDREAVAVELDETVRCMAEAADTEDLPALAEADLRFHEALIASSRSPRLNRMARTLMIETRMCLALLEGTYQDAEERVTEHNHIIEAIRRGDEEATLHLLDAHMTDAIQRLTPDSSSEGSHR